MKSLNRSVYQYKFSQSMFHSLAIALVDMGQEAINERGVFRIVLNGGSTPVGLFEVLRHPPFFDTPIWSSTEFFWGDERCVPPTADGSNYKMAREMLLDPLEIEESQVWRMKGELDPVEAAEHYTEIMRRTAAPGRGWPRFDLILLGLGQDGHTASLFPESIEPEGAAAIAVTADYDGRPAERVSLTSAVINDARHIFWMAIGEEKRGIVQRVLEGPREPLRIPAQRIEPVDGEMTWWLNVGGV